MKNIFLIFLSSILLFACVNTENSESTPSSDNEIKSDEATISGLTGNKTENVQFLKAMNEKGVSKKVDNKIVFNIPFNLHDPGGLAPDCYQSDLSFELDKNAKKEFPSSLNYEEHEHGDCLPPGEEYTTKDTFEKIEENEKHVIYHASESRTMLVLFKDIEKTGTYAYLFPGVENDFTNGIDVYTIVDNYNEEDLNMVFPVRSNVLFDN